MQAPLFCLPEARAEYDPACNRWRLTLGDHTLSLREWNWGERKRLLRATCADGQADAQRLAEGVCAMLYEPAPPADFATLFAFAGLSLIGAATPGSALPLAEAEAMLAQRYGFTPSTVDAEPVRDIEALLTTVSLQEAEPGWSRIDFGPFEDETVS